MAIERGEGLVVGRIASAGHPVLMIESASFKAARPRWGSAGAKSDAADAFMLADYARTDNHRLRRVEPVAQATRELATLVRARTALVQARTASSNQLWAILSEHWPGAAKVFHKLTSQVALAFLADYPTPQSAALLGEGRMRQFCHRHSYRRGKSAAALVGRLRAAPAAANPIAPKVLEAIIRGSIAQINLLNTEIARLEHELADALAAHPKTVLLESLPRVANVSLAALIAEIGPLLERCNNRRTGRRPVRGRTGHQCLGKIPQRRLPLHRQQAGTRRYYRLRRQLSTQLGVGWRLLPTCPFAGCSAPTHGTDTLSWMGRGDLGLLDHRHPLHSFPTPRRTTASRCDLTKRAHWWRVWPASGGSHGGRPPRALIVLDTVRRFRGCG